MAEQRIERRLAAILAADVVGYSRLTRADEAGSRAQFNAHMRESIEPCITNRRGRLVTISGDSLLVEFPSVVDAVRCALDIQDGVSRRDAEVPADRRMEFRIGINLGDVIVEGDDIHGDGVNPKVPHPRWSQATERVLGTPRRVPTQLYNGYGEFVDDLYTGMTGERLFT